MSLVVPSWEQQLVLNPRLSASGWEMLKISKHRCLDSMMLGSNEGHS